MKSNNVLLYYCQGKVLIISAYLMRYNVLLQELEQLANKNQA